MKRSNRLVILVGVLLAVLAFVGIVILLQGDRDQPATELQQQVMVAKEKIEIGDPVTPDSVQPLLVAPEAVVNTRFTDASELTGRPALVPIEAGQQVTREMVGLGDPITCISCALEEGEKAVAFQVDRVTGLDFLIQRGDYIDIVIARQLQVLQPTAETADLPRNQQRFEVVTGLENARTVKTILQNRRVLYVSATRVTQVQTGTPSASPAAGQAAAAAIENVIIVFAGTDQDAEVIKFAQNDLGELGSLTAVLRSASDKDVERTTGITIDILVEEYGIPIPGIISDLGRNQR